MIKSTWFQYIPVGATIFVTLTIRTALYLVKESRFLAVRTLPGSGTK